MALPWLSDMVLCDHKSNSFSVSCVQYPAVKQSRKRPGVAHRVPGGLGSQISITFGTLRWWGCQPQAPVAFTSRKCSWCSFSLGPESTPGPWYGQKEYVTEKSSETTGYRSREVWLVAQCLNHYATPGPPPPPPTFTWCIIFTNVVTKK